MDKPFASILESMNIIDISWPLVSGMTTYKNREDFNLYPTKLWEKDKARESRLVCSTHVGTHVDAPAHFIKDGVSIEDVPLGSLCGVCVVLDMQQVETAITQRDLEGQELASRVLFKTRNSQRASVDPFDPAFVYLDASAALYLKEREVQCVGIDYLGIERNQPDHPTHKILLESNIAIIEGLRLEHVQPGAYTLLCLPLALVGSEAAPARAVLVQG
jgi:arylformamidase